MVESNARRRVVKAIGAVAACGFASDLAFAQARPLEDLYLIRGVTFVGTPEQQKSAAPYLLKLNDDERFRAVMATRLEKAIGALRIKSGHRVQTDEASVQGDTYALSFAVSGERVEIELVDGKQVNVQYRLRAVVLVINLSVKAENRRVVAAYTVPVTYLTVADREPTAQEKLEMFRRLYMDPPANADVLTAWLRVASELDLREGNVWVKVNPFGLQAKAVAAMEKVGISSAEMALLARRFTSDIEDGVCSKFLSPVIPSVAGDTIETALIFTFNDSGAAQRAFGSSVAGGLQQTFAFPEPSWLIDFSAKDFRYVREKRQSPGGNVVDVIDVAMALELGLRPASNSHPMAPLVTTFMKREVKSFIDPTRVIQPSADTHRITERLSQEILQFIAAPNAGSGWLKGAHVYPERSADVQASMLRYSQQLLTKR